MNYFLYSGYFSDQFFILNSLSRISTISRLGAAVEEHPGHLVIPILSLEKQARGVYEIIHVEDHDIFSCCSFKPENVRGWLELSKFPEDETICPVTTLLFYLERLVKIFCGIFLIHKLSGVHTSIQARAIVCLLRQATCWGDG